MRRFVLGISGGLDSTLALIVAVSALDRLGLPHQNLTGVTMPGFGTSDRTYFNALGLMEALGVDTRDISIRASVMQHFEDIGHDPAVQDAAYENAQARERSQILFDLANELEALVVGTGDLSEAALGWCTFGGDHLAGYNVNI
ncbi:MAG: NAD(+) synthase, partial [Oscillospiraceae bacterium]